MPKPKFNSLELIRELDEISLYMQCNLTVCVIRTNLCVG